MDVTKHAHPLRFMIQIEHARGKRAVSVRVLCVKCLKSTLEAKVELTAFIIEY